MTIAKVTVKNNGLKFYTKRFICRSISRFIPLIFFFFFNISCFEHMSLHQSFHDSENFLHVPIWALPILGTQLFSGYNLTQIRTWCDVYFSFSKILQLYKGIVCICAVFSKKIKTIIFILFILNLTTLFKYLQVLKKLMYFFFRQANK